MRDLRFDRCIPFVETLRTLWIGQAFPESGLQPCLLPAKVCEKRCGRGCCMPPLLPLHVTDHCYCIYCAAAAVVVAAAENKCAACCSAVAASAAASKHCGTQALLQAREPLQASATASAVASAAAAAAAARGCCFCCKPVHPRRHAPYLRPYHPFSGREDSKEGGRSSRCGGLVCTASIEERGIYRTSACCWCLLLLTASAA